MNRFPAQIVRLVARCMAATLACLSVDGVAHAERPITIPLTYSGSEQRLVIYVGVNGGSPHPYIFDTGSQIFEASEWALAGTTVSGTLASNLVQQYVESGLIYDVVTVPSVQFYASTSDTTPILSLAATDGGFRMGSVTGTFSGKDPAFAGPVNADTFHPFSGVFGAASYTSLASGSIAMGSILGQATTTGWVVSANGPQPAVTLGLDAGLRATFSSGTNSAVYDWISGTTPFPLSGAASSLENPVVMNLAVQSGTAAVSWSTTTLFDTGTPTNNLLPDPATFAALQAANAVSTGLMNWQLVDYLSVGSTLAVTGTAGGFFYGPTLESFDTVTPYDYPPWVFPVAPAGARGPTSTLGLGFFLTNSVMYDLENGQIGMTTAYVIPEIDPTGTGTVLALVCGAIGLLERRGRRDSRSGVQRPSGKRRSSSDVSDQPRVRHDSTRSTSAAGIRT